MLQVLYYDDEGGIPHRDAETIKERLELTREIRCDLQSPPRDFADLPHEIPDAVLIDFDLRSAHDVNYFGSTLAAELRMRHPSCPIILITRPEVISGRSSQMRKNLDLDHILYKNEIIEKPENVIKQISILVKGTQTISKLRSEEKSWESVVTAMGATPDELNDLREAFPPVEGKDWEVPQMSRWIRETVLTYPGILYDDLHASARLGINIESFSLEEIETFFHSALYTGIFDGFHGRRWWSNRIIGAAKTLMLELDIPGPVTEGFAGAFQTKFSVPLSPAICITDGTVPADWVCYILRQPVKYQNSLPYHPDNRPPVMDQARVSFKAIREEQAFDETLVDADYRDIVEALWK